MDYLVCVTVLLATFVLQWRQAAGMCYFPQQFQGEFFMQSTTNGDSNIQYANVNVTANSIPIWGNCHRRIGNNFILMLDFEGTSCIRCVHLKLRSPNVLQVFTLNPSIISECYTSAKSAEESCPSEESLERREATEILLFKSRDANGVLIRKEYCPIDGKFSVRYRSNNAEKPIDCVSTDSIFDSCPSGSMMNFRLGGCSNEKKTLDLRFECLGSWRGFDGENYLIFTDNRVKTRQRVKYRCAIYSQDSKTGDIHMSLSRDSTCTTELYNASSGYETFVLTPKSELPWPADAAFATCSFPTWMHGSWEHVRVDANTMVYKDHSSFKTYTIKCVGVREEEDKYLIFRRTQCNEEQYNCMRILKRSDNIMEFQIGANGSRNNDVFALCASENFQDDSWITQGRTDVRHEDPPSNCPVSGEYTGVIPDGEDFCATLRSACAAAQLMYFEVSHCASHEVFEEREYRCLGHWSELDYLYTYTQRLDVAEGTYECFVGKKISDAEIYIKEAGEHCQRHVNPLQYGMQLNRSGAPACNETARPPGPTRPPTRRTSVSAAPTEHSTTRVWNFDTSGAETKNNENSSSSILKSMEYLTYTIIVYIVKLYV